MKSNPSLIISLSLWAVRAFTTVFTVHSKLYIWLCCKFTILGRAWVIISGWPSSLPRLWSRLFGLPNMSFETERAFAFLSASVVQTKCHVSDQTHQTGSQRQYIKWFDGEVKHPICHPPSCYHPYNQLSSYIDLLEASVSMSQYDYDNIRWNVRALYTKCVQFFMQKIPFHWVNVGWPIKWR